MCARFDVHSEETRLWLVFPCETKILLSHKAQGHRLTNQNYRGVAPKALWDDNRELFLHQGQGINVYVKFTTNIPEPSYHGYHSSIIVACSTMGTPVCAI
jgi:hypothetical protein